MAVVDPYAPCPCGSGQKFKWCCQKVDAEAEKAQRLYKNGQIEAAIHTLDEGLLKAPGNPLLLLRKSVFLIESQELEGASVTLRALIETNPGHLAGHFLLTRVVLDTEGAVAAAAQFQQLVAVMIDEGRPDERARAAQLCAVVAYGLQNEGFSAAAARHFWLATEWSDPARPLDGGLVDREPSVSLWLKNMYELWTAPEGTSPEVDARFNEALDWAEDGRWASAAAAFELLSADATAGIEADHNLALCRLWLGDNAAAYNALRRVVAKLGTTPEAVDLEALCQFLRPSGDDDLIERVQLVWPLRDRQKLLQSLGNEADVDALGAEPSDPEDPESPEIAYFSLFDRPALKSTTGIKLDDVPRVLARIFVGQGDAGIEAYDDDRLDSLIERFTAIAGSSIPPAQPKTKVIAKLPRSMRIFALDWYLPEGVPEEESKRLQSEQITRDLLNTWPVSRLPALKGRTPQQAVGQKDAAVPLRAALMVLAEEFGTNDFDAAFATVRERLGISAEPAVDPETVDILSLHLSRLRLVPAEKLNDERLVELYQQARRYRIIDVLERAAKLLAERAEARDSGGVKPLEVFTELAVLAGERGDQAQALAWVKQGRDTVPPDQRAAQAALWDMVEIKVRVQTEKPELWVPELAVIMERYGKDPKSSSAIMWALVEMGLAQIAPNPDSPSEMMMDMRLLRALFAQYGPRLTTSSGQLGVSATRGDLWTPGSTAGGSGGIWTPGSSADSPPTGEAKPRLIIPGR